MDQHYKATNPNFSPSFRITGLTGQDSGDEIRPSRFTFVLPTSSTATSSSSSNGDGQPQPPNKNKSDFSISEISKKVMNNFRDKSPRCGLDLFSSALKDENSFNKSKFSPCDVIHFVTSFNLWLYFTSSLKKVSYRFKPLSICMPLVSEKFGQMIKIRLELFFLVIYCWSQMSWQIEVRNH